jgi:hypothetical protein
MTGDSEWVEIVEPMSMADARHAFDEWKGRHPAVDLLNEDDIRIDLIRTTTGDQLRYLVRKGAWRLLEDK